MKEQCRTTERFLPEVLTVHTKIIIRPIIKVSARATVHTPFSLLQQISFVFEFCVACIVHVPGFKSEGTCTIQNTKIRTHVKSAVFVQNYLWNTEKKSITVLSSTAVCLLYYNYLSCTKLLEGGLLNEHV